MTPARCRLTGTDLPWQSRETSGSGGNHVAPHLLFQSPGLHPIQILIKPYIMLPFVWGLVVRRAVEEVSPQIK